MGIKTYYGMAILYSTVLLCALMTGCTEDPEVTVLEDSELAFYNASQVLRDELLIKNPFYPSIPALILLDEASLEEALQDTTQKQPYFGASISGQFFYPNKYGSTTSMPWLGYSRVAPGEHAITFLKTDSTLAVNTGVAILPRRRVTVYLVDSLNTYQTFSTEDDAQPGTLEVLIRILHASPDLQPIRVKVNNVWLSGDVSYRSATDFHVFPVSTDDPGQLFQVDAYSASDTTQLLGRASIQATPGHSYNVMASGYYREARYNDTATGNEIVLEPGFRLSIFRNR